MTFPLLWEPTLPEIRFLKNSLEMDNLPKNKGKFKIALKLFIIFFKIGAFTFGGGYAMIPFIQHEICQKRKWVTEQEILDIIAIAESTPGPIAINSATFVGFKTAGFWGSFFATLGVVTPSFIIILIISFFLKEFQKYTAVRYAFFGIRAGVVALIIKALISMYKQCPKKLASYLIMGLAFAVAVFTDINAIYIIIGAGLVGVSTFLLSQKKGVE